MTRPQKIKADLHAVAPGKFLPGVTPAVVWKSGRLTKDMIYQYARREVMLKTTIERIQKVIRELHEEIEKAKTPCEPEK